MKNLNFLSNQSDFGLENGSGMTREWLGNDSTVSRKLFTLLFVLLLGFGQMWGGSITITPDDITDYPSGQAAYGTRSWTDGTINGKAKVYGNTSSHASLQFNSSNRTLWNTTALPGRITSIVMTTASGTARAWKVYGGTEAATTSSTDSYGTQIGTSQTVSTTGTTYTVTTGNYTYFLCYLNASNASYIKSVVVNYEDAPSSTPTITKSSSMTTLTYSNGSPVAQYFTVGGTNLTDDVTVTAPANGKYEVSTSQNSGYGNSVELSKGNGTLANTNVYIRLKSGLAGGNISADNISITSTGATSQTISVSGSVPYKITWMANGSEHATTYVAVGSTLALPATDPVPNTCGCTGKAFYGWYGGGTSYKNASVAPSIAAAGNTVNADKTYYAVFADASDGGSTTKWVLTALSAVTEGTYALVNQTNHAFNGTINSSGHGDCTTGTFTFVNDEATSAPTGTCEIVFEAVTGGFKMKMGNNYLYASKAGSGGFSSHSTENSYWKYASSNWTYNSNSAYLRSYNATTGGLRVYGANNGDGVLRLAKKTTVSSVTYSNYETSCCTPLVSINGSFNRYHLKIFHHIIMSMFVSLIFKC